MHSEALFDALLHHTLLEETLEGLIHLAFNDRSRRRQSLRSVSELLEILQGDATRTRSAGKGARRGKRPGHTIWELRPIAWKRPRVAQSPKEQLEINDAHLLGLLDALKVCVKLVSVLQLALILELEQGEARYR